MFFTEWINSPLIQSVIISPLVGAVLGCLFSAFTSPVSASAPVTVEQTKIIFVQKIIIQQRGGYKREDNPLAYVFGLVFMVAGILWGYSRYVNDILYYWATGLLSSGTFILSAGIVSAIRGQFHSPEWGWYIFTPLIAVAVAFWLIQFAVAGIIPGMREVALRHNVLDFYFNVLKDTHRGWLMMQVSGVLLGIIATLIAVLRSVYYFALMSQRAGGALFIFWRLCAWHTRYVAGTGGLLLLVFCLGASYIMLDGYAYLLWQNFNLILTRHLQTAFVS
ncbi:TPA: hypothetical protein I8Y21_006174 [Klebsiella oxytoca]|uniref:Uncharacterized protein n=1 Tax=Klebsiella oxytoca TaxID=571 RepID=A0AAN5RGX6_KLEOX|nr:hypothetical protein [Klebsiella oxytoca]